MQIVGIDVERGTKRSWRMAAGETALGSIELPLTVIHGAKQGPVIAVTAACHPMELNGVMTSIRLARETDPAQLSGTLLIVHVQNIMGFQFKRGHISPLDDVGMGKAFPIPDTSVEATGGVSHQGLSPTFQTAEVIFKEIISRSDYLIDLHGGELHESLVPNIEILPIGDEAIDSRTRAFAQAFGFDTIWEVPQGSIAEMPTYPGRGCAVMEASQKGIPGVFCEVGGEGKIVPQLVDLTLQGIRNVLVQLDMWPGEKKPPSSQVLIGGNVLFATRGGLFLTQCQAGDRLKKKQVLGTLVDLAGETIETFEAPTDGILLNMITLGVANPGDMLYVIGNIVE